MRGLHEEGEEEKCKLKVTRRKQRRNEIKTRDKRKEIKEK